MGPRDDRREADLRRLLLRFELLSFDATADFDGAARIYRRCRAAGVTPRGMVDWGSHPSPGAGKQRCSPTTRTWIRLANVIGIEIDDASVRA